MMMAHSSLSSCRRARSACSCGFIVHQPEGREDGGLQVRIHGGGLDRVLGDEIDFPAEHGFEEVEHVAFLSEPQPSSLGVYQDIDIAVFVEVVPQDGAEEEEPLDLVLLAELGDRIEVDEGFRLGAGICVEGPSTATDLPCLMISTGSPAGRSGPGF